MNKLIIVCGSPASGKTTYGKKIATEKKAAFLDIDTVSEDLVKIALTESGRDKYDRDSDYFKKTFRLTVYETLFKIAEDNILWTDVVIAGPFTKEIRNIHWLDDLQKRFNSEVVVHFVYCSPEIRLNRIKNRGELRDLKKLDDWDNFNQYYGKEEAPVFSHIFVNNS
ncbi:MAG TPA: AAA family ATPase [Victivallales bacterium]|nr:AAA family ATPase [Victivallales bacterium]